MMAVIAMAAAAEPTDLGDNLVQGYQVELEMRRWCKDRIGT